MLYDPAISLPGIYRRDMKIYAHKKNMHRNIEQFNHNSLALKTAQHLP